MRGKPDEVLGIFARLADTLVVDYDIVDLLQMLVEACHDLLDTSAAGILLADGAEELTVVVSSDESNRLVELMQLSAVAGPGIESYTTKSVVAVPDLSTVATEWSDFVSSATTLGYRAAHAVPLRLRDTTIGALNLFQSEVGALSPEDATAAQAFADVATIGILHERALRESEVVRTQLQGALDSRVIIEQAKGAIAFTEGISMPEAFELIRSYARNNHLGIGHVATLVIHRELVLHK